MTRSVSKRDGDGGVREMTKKGCSKCASVTSGYVDASNGRRGGVKLVVVGTFAHHIYDLSSGLRVGVQLAKCAFEVFDELPFKAGRNQAFSGGHGFGQGG